MKNGLERIDKILRKAVKGFGLTLTEALFLLRTEGKDFDKLIQASFKFSTKKTKRIIRFYEKAFPPVSLTGYECELDCNHCKKHYLMHMTPTETPTKLVKVCEGFHKKGIKGVLLSGGSRKNGVVPLDSFLDAIKTVKKRFNMFIEAHTGPINHETSKLLVEAGLDAFLPDVVGDEETPQKVYGLNLGPKTYETMLEGMVKAGIKNISPHVCVGLNFGKVGSEVNALKLISKFNPTVVVITVFIPTPGTPMENVPPPRPEDVAKTIAIANLMFPKTPVSLGCVRPGGTHRDLVDRLAVKVGVSKIAVPSRSAYKEAERLGLKVKVFHQNMCCCAEEVEKTLK